MGRTAAFTKARQRVSHQKYQRRTQRTQEIRQKRRGVDEEEADRKIKKVVQQRPLPSEADQQLLIHQFKEACRLPLPSTDLCALLQTYHDGGEGEEGSAAVTVGKKRKRTTDDLSLLDTIVKEFLKTPSEPAGETVDDDEEEVTTVLEEMVQSEGGRRVVVALLSALDATQHPKKTEVARVLLEVFQENDRLVQHFIACRILSALAQYGSDEARQGVLDLMMQRATTPEELRSLLMNRHTSVTVLHLLEHLPESTSRWLCEALFGFSSDSEEEQLSAEQRLELVEDPSAGQVLQKVAQGQLENRAALLRLFEPKQLLHTKRGTTFLSLLLQAPPEGTAPSPKEKKELMEVYKSVLGDISGKLSEMCTDRNANFVVQRLFSIIPYTSDQPSATLKRLIHDMGGADTLVHLAANPIGVHVVTTLIGVGVACGTGDDVGLLLLKGASLEEMIPHPQGQLVVRRLLLLIPDKRSKVGAELSILLASKWVDYSFDAMGNLVVQDYLKAIGTAGASKCATTLVKDSNLMRMCQDGSASHVVFTLLDLVDPSTQATLCNALKGFAVQLAVHVNGRFIVEKLIRISREVRDELTKQFLFLLQSKGTQHLLCTLFSCVDARGRQHLLQSLLLPNLTMIATHQCGSVTLQKLMQSNEEVLKSVQNVISTHSNKRTELLQNFFGKFVVRIAEGTTE